MTGFVSNSLLKHKCLILCLSPPWQPTNVCGINDGINDQKYINQWSGQHKHQANETKIRLPSFIKKDLKELNTFFFF